MKSCYILPFLVMLGLTSCRSGQEKTPGEDQDAHGPREKVTVNKKYDEHGNVIEFDSTYTSYYSNIEGDTIQSDSLLSQFGMFFNQQYPSFHADAFSGMDSGTVAGFFRDDFFEQSFLHQDDKLMQMMREMDSVKNEFFRKHFFEDEGYRKK